jgi:hypothetical protein
VLLALHIQYGMRFLLSMVLLFVLCTNVQAQQTIYDETRVLYRKEMLGGIMIHGDGWGLNFFHGKHRTARDRRMLGIEIVSMKHPKEIKSFNPYYEDSRGYFFGKQNSLMIVRPSYGRKHQITDKIRRSGVEVNYVWGIGPSIGLLKPVYLQIGKPDQFPYESIAIERYDPTAHDVHNIYGRATWFRGLNEMQLHLGAFGRFGFNFEHSGQIAGIKALEVGTTIDAFPTVVPIMAERVGNTEEVIRNKQFFFGFYLSMQFGKKFIS